MVHWKVSGGGSDPGIFQDSGLDRTAPEVLVSAEDRLLRRLDFDAVLRGILQFLGSRPLPFSDRRDDLQIRGERLECHVEPNLVVSLTGATMSDGRGTMLPCDPDHELSDQRAAERRRQRILALVQGTGRQ